MNSFSVQALKLGPCCSVCSDFQGMLISTADTVRRINIATCQSLSELHTITSKDTSEVLTVHIVQLPCSIATAGEEPNHDDTRDSRYVYSSQSQMSSQQADPTTS